MKYLRGTEPSQGSVDERIARLAARRHGVFSRAELMRKGVTPRMIHCRLEAGRWERMHAGVYRLAGVPASWRQTLTAACLAAGPTAAASHSAAGPLWRLVGMALGNVEISGKRGRRCRLRGVVVHEVVQLPPVDVTKVDDIPVTSPTRTLIDLAGVLTQDRLAEVVDDALRRGLTSISRLRWRLVELGPRGGRAALRRALDARTPAEAVPQSVLETRFQSLADRGGLPPMVRQYRVRDRGRVIATVDFAHPEARLAIEIDGYRWHSGRVQWERDLVRRNALAALGWTVLHVTSRDLMQRPVETIDLIRSTLVDRLEPDARGVRIR